MNKIKQLQKLVVKLSGGEATAKILKEQHAVFLEIHRSGNRHDTMVVSEAEAPKMLARLTNN